MTTWQPYDEPLRATLARTFGIAILAGGVLAYWRGGFTWWPLASALVLWPSFGGHWLEVWFLNWLRPRLPDTRGGAGCCSPFGVVHRRHRSRTRHALHCDRADRDSATAGMIAWWIAGLGFIGIELVAQLVLELRGRPSFSTAAASRIHSSARRLTDVASLGTFQRGRSRLKSGRRLTRTTNAGDADGASRRRGRR